MESCTYRAKKLKLAAAVALTGALLLSGAGCAKDENSPVIQRAELPEWAVENENIDLTVKTADDRGVKEVYVQFDSGDKIPLTKVDSQKNGEEVANWEASFKLSPGDYSYNILAEDKAGNKSKPEEGKITVYSKDSLYGYTQGKGIDTDLSQLVSLEKNGIVDENGKAFIDLVAKYPEADELVPGIYAEILKLPDLMIADEKDIEAVEDILILASNPEYRTAFESMLGEGVEDKRKYCTPLEGLLWIAYDREFNEDNPLDDYSLKKLIDESWKRTITSNNYRSKRWKEFEEVVDRLNSPELATKYCIDNIPYDLKKMASGTPDVMKPLRLAEETFIDKTGACMDQSNLVLCCLRRNGYSYNDFDLHKNYATCRMSAGAPGSGGTGGHDTCLYIQDGKIYVIDVGTPYDRGIKGPVKTLEDAADITYPGWYSFVLVDFGDSNTKARVTKYVKKQ